MIQLKTHAQGVILPIRAQPGAKRAGVRGEQNGMLKVAVVQAAERGKANTAVVNLLSKAFSLRKSQLELISGATSRNKQFLVREIGREELARRIADALGSRH